MKILRRINEGECLPSVWWGLCWFEWQSRSVVIAPIGLNVVITACRWAWIWVAHDITRWLEKNEPKDAR